MTGLLLLAACKNSTTGDLPATNAPPYPTNAQPKLRTVKLWLGAQEMLAEVALTGIEQQTGMMFRTNITENEGMLFVFAQPHRASFWMKNTLVPLSCAYISRDGTILEIHDLKPRDETSVAAGSDGVQFVLETKQGWFQRNNVGVGALVRTERGSLMDTFFRRR